MAKPLMLHNTAQKMAWQQNKRTTMTVKGKKEKQLFRAERPNFLPFSPGT